jgi:hypothetical protein
MGRSTTDLTELTSLASGDLVKVIDVSEASTTNQDKKVTLDTITNYVGTNVAVNGISTAVVAVLDSNFASTYSSNVLTASGNGAFSPDSVTVSVSDRVLLIGQTSADENGIYTVTTVGDGSTAAVLTRAADFNTSDGVNSFLIVQSTGGTSYNNTFWNLNLERGSLVLDTDDLVFSQVKIPFRNKKELTAIPSNTITFSYDTKYILASASRAITFAASGHSTEPSTVIIEQTIDDTDVQTIDTTNANEFAIQGNGLSVGSDNVHTYDTASNSASTRINRTVIEWNGTQVTSIVNSMSEDYSFTVSSAPNTVFHYKRGTGVVAGVDETTDATWTDQKRGIVATSDYAGSYEVPVYDSTTDDEEFTFTKADSQGLLIDDMSVCSFANTETIIGHCHAIVSFPNFTETRTAISMNTSGASKRLYIASANSSSQVAFFMGDGGGTFVSTNGTTTLSTDTEYLISCKFNDDQTVDVYLDNVLEISSIDISSIDPQNFDSIMIGGSVASGTPSYDDSSVMEIAGFVGVDNFSDAVTEMLTRKN